MSPCAWTSSVTSKASDKVVSSLIQIISAFFRLRLMRGLQTGEGRLRGAAVSSGLRIVAPSLEVKGHIRGSPTRVPGVRWVVHRHVPYNGCSVRCNRGHKRDSAV